MHGMGGRILQLSTPHLHPTGRILVSVSAHSPVADHPEGLPRKENKALHPSPSLPSLPSSPPMPSLLSLSPLPLNGDLCGVPTTHLRILWGKWVIDSVKQCTRSSRLRRWVANNQCIYLRTSGLLRIYWTIRALFRSEKLD